MPFPVSGVSLRALEGLLIPIIYHIGVTMFSQPQVKITRQQPWGAAYHDGILLFPEIRHM